MIYLKSAAGGASLLLIGFVAWVYLLIRRFPGTSISFSPSVFLGFGMVRIECLLFAIGFAVTWMLVRH
ncbi:MAG TPA: hypothetical protein VHS13_01055 [Edaphobacter sp.]|jgi:hypothetical protein|nr:hypothetical protein [Edaphobacter sp.]